MEERDINIENSRRVYLKAENGVGFAILKYIFRKMCCQMRTG
jgi:hypothetical protein